MAYFAPYIDDAGLHIPTYPDIRDSLIADARHIYGQDIYLEIDAQDYQWVSVVALKMFDAMQGAQMVYNNRGPATAIGTALDGIVKINGIARSSATYSTCNVVLSGTPNTPISGGVVQDAAGYKWTIPDTIIGANGLVTIEATCTVAGSVSANPGDINKIVTPTYGWQDVHNTESAVPGANIETDSKLRQRQSFSTAQPSRTVLEGIKGAIAELSGVTRLKLYENDTNLVDADGLPPHSITAVVEGGTDDDIARAIFFKKTPGCYTNGDQTVSMHDTFGQEVRIRFYRPTYVDMDVTINIKALPGYISIIPGEIQTAVYNYLNSLEIGDDLYISSLWGAAISVMSNLERPNFSITSVTDAVHGTPQGSNDIIIPVTSVSRGNLNYIRVNVS